MWYPQEDQTFPGDRNQSILALLDVVQFYVPQLPAWRFADLLYCDIVSASKQIIRDLWCLQ